MDTVMKPVLINKRCPAQEEMCMAIRACSTEAMYYVADVRAPLGGKIVFDYDKCTECGECASECCGHAIEMK